MGFATKLAEFTTNYYLFKILFSAGLSPTVKWGTLSKCEVQICCVSRTKNNNLCTPLGRSRHLLDKFKESHPEWQEGILKNTLLMVALILDRQTVCLWKLKGSVGKFWVIHKPIVAHTTSELSGGFGVV